MLVQEHAHIADRYGFIFEEKSPATVDPRKKIWRWTIEVHRIHRVVDDAEFKDTVTVRSRGDNSDLRRALRKMPNCIIAVSERHFDLLCRACAAEAIIVADHQFPYGIATSPDDHD